MSLNKRKAMQEQLTRAIEAIGDPIEITEIQRQVAEGLGVTLEAVSNKFDLDFCWRVFASENSIGFWITSRDDEYHHVAIRVFQDGAAVIL